MKVALLGAPGTGRTTLATALAALPPEQWPAGLNFVAVQAHGCDPDAAADTLCVASEPPLLKAVLHLDAATDDSLLGLALEQHRHYDLHLLMGLDLPYQACDPEGAARRSRIDSRLRDVLTRAALPFALVYGSGPQRLESALRSIRAALVPAENGDLQSGWCWNCENCSDAICERHLFSRLVQSDA